MLILGLVSPFVPVLTSREDAPRVKVAEGTLEGVVDSDGGLRIFKGVPFAAPPVGDLRWREPQSAPKWKGVRKADAFGPRPMQLPLYGDMRFRSPGVSEDCLYLNVWAPAAKKGPRHPVLVYFYGGGFAAGDSSENRYDGAAMARKGVVAITVNYRLGVFGFLAHPALTAESPHHASGNYGLMDQAAALKWVAQNVAAFGGDPKRITIGGESAGSFSVSAQMASPLARGLLAGAIGESGAFFGATLSTPTLPQAEGVGTALGTKLATSSLVEMRAKSADEILKAASAPNLRFGPIVDGYFLPRPVGEIYAEGQQAKIPLLAGWNASEADSGPVTLELLPAYARRLFGERAEDALKAYPATTDAEARRAATDMQSDRFIGYGTWKWIDAHARTGGKPVYRYLYARPRPGEGGAVHSAEIEYALGNLSLNPAYRWTDEDRRLSATMLDYWANFVKTGDPNGPGLPEWPTLNGPEHAIMRLDATSSAAPDTTQTRYRFLESLTAKP